MSLVCPRCGVGLLVGQVAGATLHGCSRCGGIFVDTAVAHRIASAGDPAALALADQAARAATTAVDLRAPVSCPACRASCGRELVAVAGVEVDACPAHGTWFDRGELQTIAAALARWRSAQPVDPSRAQPAVAPAAVPPRPAYGAAAAVAAGAAVGVAGVGAVALAAQDPGLQERARRAWDEHGSAVADGADAMTELVDVGDAVGTGAELVASGAEVAGEVAVDVGFSLFGVIGDLLSALAD